jgi:hypothetical protein
VPEDSKLDETLRIARRQLEEIQEALQRLQKLEPTSPEAAAEVAIGAHFTTELFASLVSALEQVADELKDRD